MLSPGFSVLELLVVMAIIALLLAIALPRVGSAREQAQRNTDLANVRTLNGVTWLYSREHPVSYASTFGDPDGAHMDALVGAGYLREPIEAQHPDHEILWSVDHQRWYIDGSHLQAPAPGASSYDFTVMSQGEFDDDFLVGDGTWSVDETGLRASGGGPPRAFAGNPWEQYEVTVTAALGDGTGGGYGVFFETVLDGDGRDTGYILQFDRGYAGGRLLVRPRVDSSEQGPVHIHDPGKDDSWWDQERQLQLRVTVPDPSAPDTKLLSVSVDGEHMFEWSFTSAVADPGTNHTGFRVWGGALTNTRFKELEVEEIP